MKTNLGAAPRSVRTVALEKGTLSAGFNGAIAISPTTGVPVGTALPGLTDQAYRDPAAGLALDGGKRPGANSPFGGLRK
jgi:hypothetical protein